MATVVFRNKIKRSSSAGIKSITYMIHLRIASHVARDYHATYTYYQQKTPRKWELSDYVTPQCICTVQLSCMTRPIK